MGETGEGEAGISLGGELSVSRWGRGSPSPASFRPTVLPWQTGTVKTRGAKERDVPGASPAMTPQFTTLAS